MVITYCMGLIAICVIKPAKILGRMTDDDLVVDRIFFAIISWVFWTVWLVFYALISGVAIPRKKRRATRLDIVSWMIVSLAMLCFWHYGLGHFS